MAYVDRVTYGTAEAIKEKYNLEFEVGMQDLDHLNRLLFFKNDKLVEARLYEYFQIRLPDELVVIYPDTLFGAQWEAAANSDGSQTNYLLLTEMLV